MSSYSAPYQAVIAYLDSKDFKYTEHHEQHRVTLRMSGKNSMQYFTAKITHGGDYLQVVVNYPFLVRDEKLKPSVTELITRINYGMPLGKFEMDLKDGEVRYHIAHIIGDTGLSPDMIDMHFRAAYNTTDRYFPAFMQHIHAGYTPEDAVFHAELDIYANYMPDEPKEPKVSSRPTDSGSNVPPPITNPPSPIFDHPRKVKPKKPRRRKTSSGQDELPL